MSETNARVDLILAIAASVREGLIDCDDATALLGVIRPANPRTRGGTVSERGRGSTVQRDPHCSTCKRLMTECVTDSGAQAFVCFWTNCKDLTVIVRPKLTVPEDDKALIVAFMRIDKLEADLAAARSDCVRAFGLQAAEHEAHAHARADLAAARSLLGTISGFADVMTLQDAWNACARISILINDSRLAGHANDPSRAEHARSASSPTPATPSKKAYYDNPVMVDGFPRSHRMDHWTPAEKAINDALQVVESVGADVLLTDAVILLGDAQRKVAEYVDRQIQAQPRDRFAEENKLWLKGILSSYGASPTPATGEDEPRV